MIRTGERIDPNLPDDWWDVAVTDAPTMFEVELPALGEWLFTENEAPRVTVPVLSILGADSGAAFIQGQQMMWSWWPQMEAYTLPGASHNLHCANPSGAAKAVASFLAKHPVRSAAAV